MMPDQYRDRARATLDAMRSHEKDRLILGFIKLIYPAGDPDHEVGGADFVAEVVRLLSTFHPDNLLFPEEKTGRTENSDTPESEF